MNKLHSHLALILIVISVPFSCTYDYPLADCSKEALDKGDWIPYRGQKLPEHCHWLLFESEWRGEYYYESSGTCVDMISIPVRCDGNPLCLSFSDPVLDTFWRETSESKLIGYCCK